MTPVLLFSKGPVVFCSVRIKTIFLLVCIYIYIFVFRAVETMYQVSRSAGFLAKGNMPTVLHALFLGPFFCWRSPNGNNHNIVLDVTRYKKRSFDASRSTLAFNK